MILSGYQLGILTPATCIPYGKALHKGVLIRRSTGIQ
jgi:hypothetical protein